MAFASASGKSGRNQIHKLAESLTGEVIVAGDNRYESARRVWNRAIDARPALIARCASTEDVVRTVEFARRNDLATAVRAGGHSFAGHGTCDGGMVLDLSLMKRAEIDPVGRRVTIEGGVVSGELDCIAQAYKLATPLGSCKSVGVAGYALGGGEGSLTPKFGFGCDNIVKLEVVTADGRVLEASAANNRDLFWAMRGAGANFGVATALEFQLHPVDKVLAGHLRYPIRQARKVLRFLDEYAPTTPDEMFILAAVIPHPGERMLDIAILWPGDVKQGARAISPMRKFLKPFADTIKIEDYLEEQRCGSDAPSEGDHSSHRRGGHMERLSAEAIETIAECAANSPSESSGITMMYWHGPWCVGEFDNAFGFRRPGFEYWIHSYWQRKAMRRRSWEWVENFFERMRPFSSGAVYVNDLENEGEERVRAAYGKKYAWLAELKRKYDPENFFRVNQNIRPAPPR